MNYIGLTIGPIYKTLQNSKKPKVLWGASYIFSYIMKEIMGNFKTRKFVIPYVENAGIFEEKNDVGLFHDRFIFKSENGDLELLKITIQKVLKQLSHDMHLDENFVKEYFQIHYLEKEIDENKNPILVLTPYLDTQELFYQAAQYDENPLQEKLKDSSNFLYKSKTKKIESLQDLASNNYIAIVHADGDKMGEVIKNKESLSTVSKNLFEYCKNSNTLITNFGGETIFAGGDDLLFIVPIVNKSKTQTVFNLCDAISKDFDARFNNKATLSFGINISYEKFPLYEALQNSRELLFRKAKSGAKNNIAFKVQKHSGQSFETMIHKGNKEVYDNFLLFTSNIKGGDSIDNFLHSLHHKIDTHKTALNLIARDKSKLENFFKNYFNEDEHKQYGDFFEGLIDFIYAVFQDNAIEKKLDLVYATLRFVKFVQGDKK